MRRIVISYAREDRDVTRELVENLAVTGHQVWSDVNIDKGSRWWDRILERIRDCDVLLVVVSPAMLASKACWAERAYAMALGKPLLPVMVTPVHIGGLPSELAQLNLLDYTHRDAAAASSLIGALQRLPRARPLPNPLPRPPAPPLSYLNAIADSLQTLPADPRYQHQLVTDLEGGLRSNDPEERDIARDLLQKFVVHQNRLGDPAERARAALAAIGTGIPAGGQFGGAPPPGPFPRAPGPAGLGAPQPFGALPGPAPAKRSKAVTVLAWVGGGFVTLVVFAVGAASCAPDNGPGVGTTCVAPGGQVPLDAPEPLGSSCTIYDRSTGRAVGTGVVR